MSSQLTLMEFETPSANLIVSSATLLQCLQIAVDEYRLPPLDEDWLNRATMAASKLNSTQRE